MSLRSICNFAYLLNALQALNRNIISAKKDRCAGFLFKIWVFSVWVAAPRLDWNAQTYYRRAM